MLHHVHDGGSATAPPPPPPPTPASLQQASAHDARRSVQQMTPQQQRELAEAVSRMPVAERDMLVNDLAAKLHAPELQALEPVFTAEVILEAVQTRSPAVVREQYEATALDGGPTAPAGSGRSEAEQVEQARADFNGQVSGMGLVSDVMLTGLMAEHAGDQAYLAELVRLAMDEGLFENKLFPTHGLFERDADGSFADSQGVDNPAERRDAFALALQAALARDVVTQGQLRELAVDSADWQAALEMAGVGQAGATGETRATASEIHELLGVQQDAQKKVDQLDAELGDLLASAGPLTPEQQAAFIEAFRSDPDHKPAYDALIKSTQALSSHVEGNREALLDAAVRDPAVAGHLHDAIQTLAHNGHGVQALELLIEIERVPDSALAEAFSGFDLSGEVLENAAAAAMSELLARNDGSISAAQAAFQTLMAAGGEGAPAWGGYKDISDAMKLMNEVADGNYNAIRQYEHRFENTAPIFRAFAAATIVLGAVSAANNGLNEQYVDAIGGFAQSGEGAARLIAGAMNSLADSGRLAQHAGTFAGTAGFAAKLAPALGLVAHAASFAHNFGEAVDGNPGYAIALAGDVLGVLGSALEFTPFAPAGFIVSGIGAVISGLGSFAGEIINGAEKRAELKAYLEEAGVEPEIIDELVATGPKLFEMAEALEMEVGQVQELLLAHPGIADSRGHLQAFQDFATAAGLAGGDVLAFADALGEQDPQFASDLFNARQNAPSNPDVAETYYRGWLEARYEGAAAVAAEASPALFGEGAEQRDQAIFDYAGSFSAMFWEMEVGNLLGRNDDPHYRAEMIGQLADDGRLEQFGLGVGIYGDRWETEVRAAVADAVDAGRISQADAELVLKHFG